MYGLLSLLLFLNLSSVLYTYPFSDNGDGTKTDIYSRLIWQKCMIGQNNDAACSGTATQTTWSMALVYCKNLNLGSRVWRLPNVNEARTLYYRDTMDFPNLKSSWTSTTAYSTVDAFLFSLGFVYQNKAYSSGVRCVSGP